MDPCLRRSLIVRARIATTCSPVFFLGGGARALGRAPACPWVPAARVQVQASAVVEQRPSPGVWVIQLRLLWNVISFCGLEVGFFPVQNFVDAEPQMSTFMRLLLCYGHQRRIFWWAKLVHSLCAITHFKNPWLLHPSSIALSSSHGACSSIEIMCSSSSIWRRISLSMSGSGGFRV